jgi:hypothetical protein
MPPPPNEDYGSKSGFVAKHKWTFVGAGVALIGGLGYWIWKSHSTSNSNTSNLGSETGSLGTTTGGEQYLIPSGAGYSGYSGGGGGGLYSEITQLESDITGLTTALTGYTPPSTGGGTTTPAITNGTSPAPAGSGSPSGSSGSTPGNASGSGGGSAGSTSPPVAVTNTVQTYGVGDFDTTVNNTLLDQALTAVATTGAPATVAQTNALATFSSEGHPIADTIDPTTGSGPAGYIPPSVVSVPGAQTSVSNDGDMALVAKTSPAVLSGPATEPGFMLAAGGNK